MIQSRTPLMTAAPRTVTPIRDITPRRVVQQSFYQDVPKLSRTYLPQVEFSSRFFTPLEHRRPREETSYHDIAYEAAPLVDQDEYFRRVVTYPGLPYDPPRHNEILRAPSDGTWVRAVHYPVATDLNRQVPFKTDNIGKTYGQAYPSAHYPEPLQPKQKIDESMKYSRRPIKTDDSEYDVALNKFENMLKDIDPSLAQNATELFANRDIQKKRYGKLEVIYPNEKEIREAADGLMKDIPFDRVMETVVKVSELNPLDVLNMAKRSNYTHSPVAKT